MYRFSSSSQSESYFRNGAEMDRFNIITFAPAKPVVEQRGSDLLQRDGFFTFFSSCSRSCWTFLGKQCWPGWLFCRQNRTPTSVFWVACVFPIFRKPRTAFRKRWSLSGSTEHQPTSVSEMSSRKVRRKVENSKLKLITILAVIKPVV